MSFIREKEIDGNKYLYLVESKREGDKVRQKVVAYLGPKTEEEEKVETSKIKELLGSSEDEKQSSEN